MLSPSDSEELTIIILTLFCLFILLVIRNWYNLYRKRSFRKKNKQLNLQLTTSLLNIDSLNKQLKNVTALEEKLTFVQAKSIQSEKELEDYKQKFYSTLSKKEQEIEKQKEVINHQKKAYERYVNFKNVETNNTRLGAHFIKNVINQIYMDLESAEDNHKSFLGIYYSFKKTKNKIPSLKALKHIFKLLDYNVSALNKEHISLEEEWNHINMFMELIQYLKPNANIQLKNLLSIEQKKQLRIKPTLFFPFVENALKHGRLNDRESFISITLKETEERQINYCLVNSAEHNDDNPIKDKKASQFGLNALQQLLDAYYPNSVMHHKTLPNQQYISELTFSIN